MVSSDDDGRTWGAFSFVSIAEYDYAQGDVYFFVVAPNPAHEGSLLALFPLAHKFRGCIGLAASVDGLHWSAPTPLLRCAVHGERAVHHPAQGLVSDGDSVVMFVHENVPGVTSDHTPTAAQMVQFPYLKLPRCACQNARGQRRRVVLPRSLPSHRLVALSARRAHAPRDTMRPDTLPSSLVTPFPLRPRLVRHTIPRNVLRDWTLSALRPENMSSGPPPTR